MRVLGLMSGTSADGIDAVLVQLKGDVNKPNWQLLNTSSIPYPEKIRKFIVNVGQGVQFSSDTWMEYAEQITELNFRAASICDPRGTAELVGCHGQTVFHRPPKNRKRGASWQLLQAPLLATLLDCPVVFDFRAADMCLGGEGAPLVPLADEALIGRTYGWRALLNLGGIANITLIPPLLGPDKMSSVFGWDCGPANTLIDLAVQKFSDDKLQFDRDGCIAASGSPDKKAINRWLKQSYFQRSFPKSTGREKFGLHYMNQLYQEILPISLEDLIATITSFSASIIGQDLDNLFLKKQIRPIELFVAGGGSKNLTLMEEIRSKCLGIRISNLEEMGILSQSREALAFALLAWWHIKKKEGNSLLTTGARKKSILGMKVNPAGK